MIELYTRHGHLIMDASRFVIKLHCSQRCQYDAIRFFTNVFLIPHSSSFLGLENIYNLLHTIGGYQSVSFTYQ